MRSKILILLLAVCMLVVFCTLQVAALSARDGEVGDSDGVVTTAGVATTAPTVTSASPATTAVTLPVTTGAMSEGAENTGGAILAIVLAVIAAAAIVTLVVILVPRMRGNGKH